MFIHLIVSNGCKVTKTFDIRAICAHLLSFIEKSRYVPIYCPMKKMVPVDTSRMM